ncbi:hypothetical protein GH733_015953 [Mirounga leonina]|nr:hypothetical protein GH733_015953 [Mirounga leonina]
MGAMEARGARVALCGVTLLCAVGLGQRPAGGVSCGPGRLLRGTGTDARCCRLCALAEACPEGDCTCVEPGYHCGDPQCKTCKHHICPPGQEGISISALSVSTVPQGPSLEARRAAANPGQSESWWDPQVAGWFLREGPLLFFLVRCSQFGYPTMFPGNKTHNAVCSLGLPPAEPHGPLTIVLLTVAACILVLSAAQLGLHIWQLRRQPVWPPETQLPLEARPPAEDACSCQFPEEERGEQLSEDKGQLRGLWV